MPSDDLVAMRESVQTYGFTDPVIWTYGGSVLDGWHRYTIANLLSLELEVREYDGDPVQWVISRNLHRRHLTALQRASCVSAALEWAKQGYQQVMHTERDDSGQYSPIHANIACIGEPISTSLIHTDSGQVEQESFSTQDERAALSDVSVRTQAMSDTYEKAGLGPEIRSGAITGVEAEFRVRDPDTPRPPSRVQQLEMQVEAQALVIDSLQRELREAKSQVSEYPHEREVVANEREVIISAQSSSIAELQTKLNDEKRRASHFQQKCMSLEAEAQEG